MARAVLGTSYDGISQKVGLTLDSQIKGGALTRTEAANLTAEQYAAFEAAPEDPFTALLVQEYAWRSEANVPGGRRLETGRADTGVVGAEPGHNHRQLLEAHRRQLSNRRRLNEHDEWGGVQLSLRLAQFANVYQLGHKPGWMDVIAAIGAHAQHAPSAAFHALPCPSLAFSDPL